MIEEMLIFYQNRIADIDLHYLFTQDKDRSKVDFKKRSKQDISEKSIYEDFIADLKRLQPVIVWRSKEELIVALKDALIGYQKNVGEYENRFEFIQDNDFKELAEYLMDLYCQPPSNENQETCKCEHKNAKWEYIKYCSECNTSLQLLKTNHKHW